MSDTPRTNNFDWSFHLLFAESQKMERELNAAQQRIKQLEDALNGTVKWIVDLADSGDAGFWDAEEVSEIIAARKALQAKEAKP